MSTAKQARSSTFSSTASSCVSPWEKPEVQRRGFTESWIAGLAHGPKRYEVGDPRAPGLCIRVAAAPGKSKSWVWYAAPDEDARGRGEKRCCVGFGRWPTVSIEAARLKLEVHKAAKSEGRLEQLRKPAPPPVGAHLVSALAEDFYKVTVMGKRRHPWRVRGILDNYILPTIGHLEVATLTTRNLRAPTEKAVADGSPVQAAAVLQVTKAVTAFAAGRGDLTHDVGAPLKAKALGAVTMSRRKRRVEDAELPALLAGLKTVTDPTRTLLRLLLTTGVRTGELLNAPWSEFDLKHAVWTIPPERQKLTLESMKGAEAWRVPLAPAAVALLNHLRALEPKSAWVASSSETESGHVTDKVLSHAMRRLQGLDKPSARISEERAAHRKARGSNLPGPKPGRGPRMALPGGPVNAHDFRRTLRSWLEVNECPFGVAERCLGHKMKGVERVYAVADLLDQRREWLNRWAAHLATAEKAN